MVDEHDVIIIGGGISGLSALHFLRHELPDADVVVYEASERLGGTVGADHIDGYSFDWGPNGFLDREPLTLELCRQLGLEPELERANHAVKNRYVLRGGRLRPVPMSPGKFLTSDILGIGGRLRVLLEPLAPKRPEGGDESVYDFAARRIGREAADYLVQPMVSGIHGGVAKQLSLASCFPVMRQMEEEHGSLVKAMFARAKKRRKDVRGAGGGPSGPAGWLTSFKGGLYRLIERIVEEHRAHIRLHAQVEALERQADGRYLLRNSDGRTASARRAVLATPAYAASSICAPLSKALSEALAEIPYAPINVVCLGYARSDVAHPLDGFGFLVPPAEGRHILGCIWTSSVFDGRAPEQAVQLRAMLGGAGNPAAAEASDETLITWARDDLEALLAIRAAPQISRVYRWPRGIPQFQIGHRDIIERIEAALAELPGVYLTGNAYYGVGLNDCIKQSASVVRQLRAAP